ncbi:MAG: ring-cleaving dioxygenase [Caldilineaceae bacterium]|nr:ring-cleaving dioxygenase [Caldilineaceae bacterium]
MQPVQGIHHITAIASDPQRNLNFYHGLLGQRLVKKTVNFDDPGTYHFYFADKTGTPGTVLTFFPWRHMARGVRGNGEVGATAYSIRPASVDYWRKRLAQNGVAVATAPTRFGNDVFSFADPDGMIIELVVNEEQQTFEPWDSGPIPGEHELRGFHSATLWVANAAATDEILTAHLGYQLVGSEGSRIRYQGAGNDIGLYIDLLEQPGLGRGRLGAGSVHHIAYRTVDDSEQAQYLALLQEAGYGVSPVMDRQYFHSIYFREPNGVLFEVATDAPGFLYDEAVDELGTHLKLPHWLEPRRGQIEQSVVPVTLSAVETKQEVVS